MFYDKGPHHDILKETGEKRENPVTSIEQVLTEALLKLQQQGIGSKPTDHSLLIQAEKSGTLKGIRDTLNQIQEAVDLALKKEPEKQEALQESNGDVEDLEVKFPYRISCTVDREGNLVIAPIEIKNNGEKINNVTLDIMALTGIDRAVPIAIDRGVYSFGPQQTLRVSLENLSIPEEVRKSSDEWRVTIYAKDNFGNSNSIYQSHVLKIPK